MVRKLLIKLANWIVRESCKISKGNDVHKQRGRNVGSHQNVLAGIVGNYLWQYQPFNKEGLLIATAKKHANVSLVVPFYSLEKVT